MREMMFSVTIGDHDVEVSGWQAALIAGVMIGLPWVVGVVAIVRGAMYGW